MKVKIGETIYDSKNQPIMIILSDYEKECISKMIPEAHKFLCYEGDQMSEKQAREFMKT